MSDNSSVYLIEASASPVMSMVEDQFKDYDNNNAQHGKICAACVKVLHILDLLESNHIFACDTAATIYFVKSKEGVHNCLVTEIVSQRMTG